jgi:hypothetical protein
MSMKITGIHMDFPKYPAARNHQDRQSKQRPVSEDQPGVAIGETILDEATSSVDARTEVLNQRAMSSLIITAPSTIILKYDRNNPFSWGFQAHCIFILILWNRWLAD